LEKIGLHAQGTSELSFTDMPVPAENLLGEEGQAFYQLVHNLPQERLSLAMAAVAAAEGVLAETRGRGEPPTPQSVARPGQGISVCTVGGFRTRPRGLLTALAAGIAVHIGARVSALAGPNEVLVSSTLRDLVIGSGLEFEARGAPELKGVPGEWHLFAVASA
jgi:class 3 adenylate cyclase